MTDWTFIDQFHFMRPWWLLALIPMLLALLNLKRLQNTSARWENVIAPHLLDHIIVKGNQTQRFTPLRLAFAFTIISVISLSGPSWRQAQSPFFQDEAPLVIALDLSASMQQDDIQPTRLERAKQKVQDLLAIRGGAPTGLIVYSGSAHTAIPLTEDPDIVINLLAAITPEIMPTPGKLLQSILPLVDQILSDSEAPGTLLLMTDGIEGSDIAAFRNHFSKTNDQLLVWGVGSSEPDPNMTTEFVALQESQLRELSRACGGHYESLTLKNVDAKRLQRLTKSHLVAADDQFTPWVDDGYYLAIPMALLIALWFRKGWTLSWE